MFSDCFCYLTSLFCLGSRAHRKLGPKREGLGFGLPAAQFGMGAATWSKAKMVLVCKLTWLRITYANHSGRRHQNMKWAFFFLRFGVVDFALWTLIGSRPDDTFFVVCWSRVRESIQDVNTGSPGFWLRNSYYIAIIKNFTNIVLFLLVSVKYWTDYHTVRNAKSLTAKLEQISAPCVEERGDAVTLLVKQRDKGGNLFWVFSTLPVKLSFITNLHWNFAQLRLDKPTIISGY